MARGKYANVIDKLPRLVGREPDYQAKVEAVKAAIKADPDFKFHASALAAEFVAARAEKDEVSDILYEVNLRLEAVSDLMVDAMEAEGITALRLDDGHKVIFYAEPHVTVVDKAKLRQWCIEDGLEPLMTLPWQTLNNIAKQRLIEGLPDPDGAQTFSKIKVRLD